MLLYLPILDIYVQKKISIIVHVKLAKFIMTIFFPWLFIVSLPFLRQLCNLRLVPLDMIFFFCFIFVDLLCQLVDFWVWMLYVVGVVWILAKWVVCLFDLCLKMILSTHYVEYCGIIRIHGGSISWYSRVALDHKFTSST